MKIFVSNLGDQITGDSLNAIFSAHGRIASSSVEIENVNGSKRNVAFLDMPDEAEAHSAIARMDGAIVNGKVITVQEA
ncbi:MAG TPA: RNA-binding protein [Flavisolibacter sp.]|jgi:RNA recognition motif-containing protein|nr:RNA-binding protein [Flavisolibacter sp.]HZH99493.1 RNA-binding protein [Flavisolibacter sp.]